MNGDLPHARRRRTRDQGDRAADGRDRKTIRKAIRSSKPPRYRPAAVASALDPYRDDIARLDVVLERVRFQAKTWPS